MAIEAVSESSGSHLADQAQAFKTHEIFVTAGRRDWQLTALVDRQQYDDPVGDHAAAGVPPASWSLFGVMWPSAVTLANLLDAQRDHLQDSSVLELGCGLALPSLVLASNNVNVVASDMHPLAANFLEQNCRNNHVPNIPFKQCHWPSPIQDSSFAGRARYDWIIGSDLLYESGQPERLISQIKLSAEDQTKVMITDPGRGQLAQFERAMGHLGFSAETGNDDHIRWRRFSR
ncbi:MAG: methyltransferase domain-containing protein [Pseudomonadota bacterium]